MIVGTLLLLVTVGDLSGLMPGEPPAMQLAAPTAAAALPTPTMLPAPQAGLSEAATDQAATDGVVAPPPGAFETALQEEPRAGSGTEREKSASEQMLAANGPAQPRPRSVATSAAAAVTQAIPTPGASGAAAEPTARTAAPAGTDNGGRPSWIRLLQFALALLLAWLVVSIAGLRWVRRLR
jgi:hypothetical protein